MLIREITDRDSEHRKELSRTGFWGKQAAGSIIYAASTGRFCLAHRSKLVQEPNTWGIWGGAIDEGEDPKQAALRELHEETGYAGGAELELLWIFEHNSGFRYYNFLATVEDEFTPRLDWETQGYRWVEWGDWPQPLHPGVATLLSRSDVGQRLAGLSDK
jgi:8-oxo-dGTP pyrophosphatase MutT (NUDIX family)